MKIYIYCFVLFTLFYNLLYSQNNCPPIYYLKTSSVNDGKDSSALRLTLHFKALNDSIVVSTDSLGHNRFLAFAILYKECTWSSDSTQATFFYKLQLKSKDGVPKKFPSLRILIRKNYGHRVELLYENAEKRVFYS